MLPNFELVRSFKAKVNFTPEQWSLFTSTRDCSYAARELNNQLEQSLNTHHERREVELEMMNYMDRFSVYGASDTEPRAFLAEVLDHVFGHEDEEDW